MINSTVSGNSAVGPAPWASTPAVAGIAFGGGGTATMISSTISGNRAMRQRRRDLQ